MDSGRAVLVSPIPTGHRRTVLERSGGLCERCAVWLANVPADIHHRNPRRAGGTKRPEIHAPANLTVICRKCHRWVESQRTLATEQGWLISQHDQRDPSEIPIYVMGEWFTIDDTWHPFDYSPPF